jgi:hypothetical protein
LRAKALESVSDATLAVFSSVFGHFRFNRCGRCSVRGGNAAKQRQPFAGPAVREPRAARLAVAQTELEAAEMEWLELELLREDLTSGSWLQEPATTLLYDFIRLLGLDIATSQSTFRMRIGRDL